jgi:hypothetical protein
LPAHSEALGDSRIENYVNFHAPPLVDLASGQSLRAMGNTPRNNRRAHALTAAREFVDALESNTLPIEQCLMKAQRLARLLRNEHAQTWLDLETRGYLDRLLAYVEQRINSRSTKSIVEAQIKHLAARLDAVHDKACKGVHDEVTSAEARLVLIQTYLFLAEIARMSAPSPAAKDGVPVGSAPSSVLPS